MIDLRPTITQAPAWTDEALAAQFKLCEQWQDAEQWGILGDLYRQKYGDDCMNARYCFRKWNELTAGSDRREEAG
jgi:lysozyme family protein